MTRFRTGKPPLSARSPAAPPDSHMTDRGPRRDRGRRRATTLRFWPEREEHAHGHPDAGAGGRDDGRPTGAPRILVVDDEVSIRTICRINLEAAGIEVIEAEDGEAALQAIATAQPDLVLLDVMMPGLDGWQVAVELASSTRTSEIPVVFLTARSEQAARAKGHELGGVGYISKPFDPIELADRIRDVLRRLRRGERDQLRRELLEER